MNRDPKLNMRIEIATVVYTSNLIGILFSRSLHYQFYSWYAQQIPFVVCKTVYPWWIRCVAFVLFIGSD